MSFEESHEAILSLYARGFALISRIDISREVFDRSSSPFTVTVWLSNGLGKEAMILATGCIDVRVGNLNNMVNAFVEVFDIRSSQIEGARFKIVETENDLFSFFCLDIEVSTVI